MLPLMKRRSFSIRLMMHWHMMRLRTSTPKGQTMGFLFNGISLHALYDSREFSATFSVAS